MASTSAVAAPPPTDLKELDYLFAWNPPRLVPVPKQASDKKASTSARKLAFFDLHFSGKLLLKRVVRLPSLVEDLARTVDLALDAAKHSLPELSGHFPTTEERMKVAERLESYVSDERGVCELYSRTTAEYCPIVASTLALHPKVPRWMPLIRWTQAVSSSRHATMDAELTFYKAADTDAGQRREDIIKTMGSGRRQILETMRKKRSALTTYQFKSLSEGPVEVMTAVRKLGDFDWISCASARNPCRLREHKKIRDEVEAISEPGPDARRPPWNIQASNSSSEETVQTPQTMPASSEPVGAKKRKKTQVSKMSEGRTTAKGKGKKHPAYLNHYNVSAQSLVQQAWVQATKADTSLIVLHSGNHELICVRHRESQTLYVSNLIQPYNCINPGYGKLHIGVCIASIEDMFDRKEQEGAHADSNDEGSGDNSGGGGPGGVGPEAGGPGAGGRGHGGSKFVHGKGGNLGKSGGRGVKKKKMGGGDNPIEDELAMSKIICVASKCRTIHMYLRYDVYDSPVPSSFTRALPLPMPSNCPDSQFSPCNHTHGLDECLTVVITSEVGQGATGVALRGTLKPENMEGAAALDVVVKLAFDDGQRDSLKKEYKLYLHLRTEGVQQGITPIIGFFDDDTDGSACALVMLYAGVPISDLGRNLTATERNATLSTLESIHCAGVLHDDIRPDNILTGDSGITMIDFGHARWCSSKKAKSKEYMYLQSILQGFMGESQ